MAVSFITLYLAGQQVQVVEGSQLHFIYASLGATASPPVPGPPTRPDPFPQYVHDDEVAALVADAAVPATDPVVAALLGDGGSQTRAALDALDLGGDPITPEAVEANLPSRLSEGELRAAFVSVVGRPDTPLRYLTGTPEETTDWAPALRAAIGNGGKTVELPGLTMTLASRWGQAGTAHVIDIKDDTTLIGNPATTKFVRASTLPPGSPVFFARDRSGFSLGGFKLDGNQAAITGTDGTNEDEGINVKTSTNFRLHDLEIFETFQEAVDIDGGSHVWVENVYAHDCGGNGFHFTGSGGVNYLTATGLIAENTSARRAATGLVQIGGLHHTGSHAYIEAKIIGCYKGAYIGVGTDRRINLDITQVGDQEAVDVGDGGTWDRTFLTLLVKRTGATNANIPAVRLRQPVTLMGGSISDTSPSQAIGEQSAGSQRIIGTAARQLGTGYCINLGGTGSGHILENIDTYAAAAEALRITMPNVTVKGGRAQRGNAGTVVAGTTGATNVDIFGMDVRGSGNAQVSLTGTGARKRQTSGYISEVRGSVTIPDGSASIAFNHGLGPVNAGTDVAYRGAQARSTTGSAPEVWYSAMTATQATISRAGTTGAQVVDYTLSI